LLSEAASPYVVATMLLYTIAAVAPGISSSTYPATGIDWLTSSLMIIFVGGGTCAAYRANGGPGGVDFTSRYFALGWVILVRLAVLLFLPAMVLVFVASGGFEMEGELTDRAFGWAGAAVGITLEITYYSRLVYHLRELAAARAG
jgi:hypothetical protein